MHEKFAFIFTVTEEVVVKTDEIQIEAPPEKEEPMAVKEEENLPQEIIIDKGNF